MDTLSNILGFTIYLWETATWAEVFLAAGAWSLFNTKFLLIPAMKLLNINTATGERWGCKPGEKKVINAYFIKAFFYHLSWAWILFVPFTVYQIEMHKLFDADLSKGLYLVIGYAFAKYWPRLQAIIKIITTRKIVFGNSITVDGHHGVLGVSRSAMTIELINPRDEDDITFVPISKILGDSVRDYGPYGKPEEQKYRLKASSLSTASLNSAAAAIHALESQIEDLKVMKVDLGVDNTLEITYKIKSICVKRRDNGRNTLDFMCVDIIKDSKLVIADPC